MSKVKWYQKKEVWAGVLFIAGGVKQFTKPNTFAHQFSDYTITIGIPLAMGILGVKDGLKNNSLPFGIRKKYGE